MTFNLLPLQDFAASDTAYVDYMNTNNSSLTTMLTGVQEDLLALDQNTAVDVAAEWYRKIDLGDPPGGALGPYSFVCNIPTPATATTVSLTHGNANGNSYAYVGSTKYNTSATLLHTFTSADMTAGSAGIMYLGIDVDPGTLAVSMNLNSSIAEPDLILYTFYLANASGVFTVTEVKRFPRSLLMSNTLEQLRQETPQVIHMNLTEPGQAITASSQGTFDGTNTITIPYDHVWQDSRISVQVSQGTDASDVVTLDIDGGATILSADVSAAGNSITMPVQSPYIGVPMAANTVYSVGVVLAGGSAFDFITSPQLSLFVRRSYNLPPA